MVEWIAAGRRTRVKDVNLSNGHTRVHSVSFSGILRCTHSCTLYKNVVKSIGSIASAVEQLTASPPVALADRLAVETMVSIPAEDKVLEEEFITASQSYFKNFSVFSNFTLPGFSRQPLNDVVSITEAEHKKLPQQLAREEEPNPVHMYMMLPLDTINADGAFRYAGVDWFQKGLTLMACSGVRGVAVDVWWGAVEVQPRKYNFSGYKQLVQMVKSHNLKLQVVLSFHACGGNVGDAAQIPLPSWVLKAGESEPDLFYMDAPRGTSLRPRNRECISLFADMSLPGLGHRTPMQCYEDFMHAFSNEFSDELARGVLEEVVIGSGPCGELRYPSYPETNGWRFPGVGEFQCYDRRAAAKLAEEARCSGHPEWGTRGPHDAGSYNSRPEDAAFFRDHGSWRTDYGRFFLSWYSNALLEHGERLLQAAHRAFQGHIPSARVPVDELPPTPPYSPVSLNPLAALASGSHGALAALSGSLGALAGFTGIGQQRGPPSFTALSASASTATLTHVDSLDMEAVENSDVSMTESRPPRGAAPACAPSPSTLRTSTTAVPMDGVVIAAGEPLHATAASVSLSSMSTECTTTCCNPLEAADDCDPTQCYIPEDIDTTFFRFAQYDCASTASSMAASSAASDEPPPSAPTAPVTITLKIAGIHWWHRSASHAAELTAGYYHTADHDGYAPIVQLCAKYRANLTLTCVEMDNAQHPTYACCGPEDLLRHVRALCAAHDVQLSGENALPIFRSQWVNSAALRQIVKHAQPTPTPPPTPVSLSPAPSANNIIPVTRKLAAAAGGCSPRSGGAGQPAAAAVSPLQLQLQQLGRCGGAGGGGMSPLPALRAVTFLRLDHELVKDYAEQQWRGFMRDIHAIGGA